MRIAVLLVGATMFMTSCAAGSDTATTSPTAATSSASTPDVDTTAAPATTAPHTTEAPTTTQPQAPTSPAEVQSSTGADDPASTCRRLTDFTDATDWFIVNDGVMGGRSNGTVNVGDSTLTFSGTVVTDGGGFTSVRYRLQGTEMIGSTRLSMRVRADDRVYGVTLEDDADVDGRSVSHRSDIDTRRSADEGWITTTVEYSALTPSLFGRSVDAPPFNPDAAREVGIIIADGLDGDFSLEVDWIDLCN